MILRADVRGGVHTPYISVTSVTSVTRPVYAGCRGAQVEHKRNKVEQQVEQPRETGHFLAKTGIL